MNTAPLPKPSSQTLLSLVVPLQDHFWKVLIVWVAHTVTFQMKSHRASLLFRGNIKELNNLTLQQWQKHICLLYRKGLTAKFCNWEYFLKYITLNEQQKSQFIFLGKQGKVTVLFILQMPGAWASRLIPVFGGDAVTQLKEKAGIPGWKVYAEIDFKTIKVIIHHQNGVRTFISTSVRLHQIASVGEGVSVSIILRGLAKEYLLAWLCSRLLIIV